MKEKARLKQQKILEERLQREDIALELSRIKEKYHTEKMKWQEKEESHQQELQDVQKQFEKERIEKERIEKIHKSSEDKIVQLEGRIKANEREKLRLIAELDAQKGNVVY